MNIKNLAVALALILFLSGCDLFADDDGEFEATLSGGVTRTLEGGSAHVDGEGAIGLESEFDAETGGELNIDWHGSGLPEPGTYPVVSADDVRSGDLFTARAKLETGRGSGDLVLVAIDGEVTITESGGGVSGTAEFTMEDERGSTDEVETTVSFRAVPR